MASSNINTTAVACVLVAMLAGQMLLIATPAAADGNGDAELLLRGPEPNWGSYCDVCFYKGCRFPSCRGRCGCNGIDGADAQGATAAGVGAAARE
ncbi:hypothetical protein ACP70R_006731 [Stipagrostis hirtigluma subsp. patula]